MTTQTNFQMTQCYIENKTLSMNKYVKLLFGKLASEFKEDCQFGQMHEVATL